MHHHTPSWLRILVQLRKALQHFAILLKLLWVFFPGVLLIAIAGHLLTHLLQGQDVVMIALESKTRGFFVMTGLVFWAVVAWYSSRLIAYNKDSLFELFPQGLYHAPRLIGYGCFAAILYAFLNLPVLGLPNWLPGWILAMLGLNMVPGMALKAARQSPRNAAMLLAGHGAFAGVCLSPLIFLAMLVSGVGTDAPNLVQSALVITAAVFLGISGYIYQSGASFNYGKGFGVGLAWTLFAGIGMSYLFPMSSGFGLFILLGVGLLGTLQLLWATSSVLRDPDFRDPAYGALMLFAGLFNLFQVILSLLIRSRR
jgi:FtsH-binding integral membrane protein